MSTFNQSSKKIKPRIPIVILNGFLGSGKTTLFRNLLNQSKKNDITVSAIVNDMSELDVDGELIGNTDIVENNKPIFQSIHSCVLSSKVGIKKLEEALDKLLSYQHPELIIIETSGSCHPMPLIEFFKNQRHLKLTGVLALVDSVMLALDYDNGNQLIPKMQSNLMNKKRDMINLLVEQIMFCSHLILTRPDKVSDERLIAIANSIQPINPFVSILSMLFGNLPLDKLLTMPEYDYHRVAQLMTELKPTIDAESQGDRPYNMATRVIKDDRPFHPQRLWEVCHKYLDQRIYRSKGFFWLATRDKLSLLWNQAAGSINLELVGYWRAGILEDSDNGLLEIEKEGLNKIIEEELGRFGDRHCHITVIGDKTQVDRFTQALKLCFLTDYEITQWKHGHKFPDPWPESFVQIQ
ncbi:MAG: GTP-binding protein [Bacteroidota bacterium]